jgi:two-component system NtrC family response regulator
LLIVEDDEGLQRQLKWAYEGYRVVSAGDRSTAIEMMRLHEPAVVTLDLGPSARSDGTSEGFATLTEILALKPDTQDYRRFGSRGPGKRAEGDRARRL